MSETTHTEQLTQPHRPFSNTRKLLPECVNLPNSFISNSLQSIRVLSGVKYQQFTVQDCNMAQNNYVRKICVSCWYCMHGSCFKQLLLPLV